MKVKVKYLLSTPAATRPISEAAAEASLLLKTSGSAAKRSTPPGYRWIFRRWRRVPNSHRRLDAHAYGYKAWPILVRDNRYEMLDFVSDWRREFGSKQVTARELMRIARRYFDAELGNGSYTSRTMNLSKIVSKHRSEVISGYVLTMIQTTPGALYRLEPQRLSR